MKLRKFLFLSAITLGFVACSDEDVPHSANGSTDASISIKVYPASTGSQTRAIGDLKGDGVLSPGLVAESEIKQLEVWIFNGNALEKYASVTGSLEIKDIEVTSGARKLVVVANANLGTQATLSALTALTKKLSQDISKGLVMTADPLDVALVKGENFYGYPGTTTSEKNYISTDPLALIRINARVAIVGATLNLATPGAGEAQLFDGLTDAQVALFNVPEITKLFGAELAQNAAYLFGKDWLSTSGSYMSGTLEQTLFEGAVAFPIVNTAAPYFYVNENTAKTEQEQMLIVLRAKPTLSGVAVVAPGLYTDASGYTYYPVWVNAIKNGYSYNPGHTADSKIIRNTQYNISLSVTGIGNPSIDPAETAFLDVKVVVKPWEVVNQQVIW